MVRIILGFILLLGTAGHGDFEPTLDAVHLLPGLLVGSALFIWGVADSQHG
jgi:hypothetical protein